MTQDDGLAPVRNLLERWGQWQHNMKAIPRLGYKPIATHLAQPGRNTGSACGDCEAPEDVERMEQVMLKAKHHHPRLYLVAEAEYLLRFSPTAAANYVGLSRSKYYECRALLLHYCLGALEGVDRPD